MIKRNVYDTNNATTAVATIAHKKRKYTRRAALTTAASTGHIDKVDALAAALGFEMHLGSYRKIDGRHVGSHPIHVRTQITKRNNRLPDGFYEGLAAMQPGEVKEVTQVVQDLHSTFDKFRNRLYAWQSNVQQLVVPGCVYATIKVGTTIYVLRRS